MKKVLICAYSLDIGGIEKALINLLKNIDYDKYQVDLILHKKEGIFLKDVPSKVIIKEFNYSKAKNKIIRKIGNLLAYFKFFILNHHKYDISLAFTTYDNVGARLSLIASKNSTLFIHGNYYDVYKGDIPKIKEFFSKLKVNKFKRLVFVSNEAREGFLKVFKTKEETTVINNLIDYEDILVKAKEEVNFLKDKINLLYVGRLTEEDKAVSRIINLMTKLDNAMLHVVGSGLDENMYKEMVKELSLDNVIFYGKDNNPYKYMKEADYILLSSNYEGFPVVYNEALVLNKQVISTVDASDDIYKASDYFFIVSKDNFIKEASNIINNYEQKKYIQPDFEKINLQKLEKILTID